MGAYEDNNSFSFEGTPEKIDVEQELNDNTKGTTFDAYKLTEVLMIIIQKMIGVNLYDYQKAPAFRIIYSMLARDGAEVTMLFARQSGKSEVVTFVAVGLGVLLPVLAKIFPKELGHFKNGIKMGLLAPQGEQVDTVYKRCMERLLSEPVKMFLTDPDIDDVALSQVNFKLKSGSTLTGQSAAKQSKIESKTYHLVFMDEAQDIGTEKVRKSIMPMLASTFGTAVRTGTPARQKGDFYHTIQNNKKEDKKLKSKKVKKMKQLHFEYNYLQIIEHKKKQYKLDQMEFHTLYAKSVERDRKSSGENSDFFRLAYKIEWLLDVGMFISEAQLEAQCYNKRITKPTIEKGDFIVAGLDIASARNSTVLTTAKVETPAGEFGERPKKQLIDWLTLSGVNYEEQFHILAENLLSQKVQVLYTDNTGVGRALTDILVYHLSEYMEIIPYTFSPSSKSDMWKMLDEDIGNKKLEIPAHQTIRDTKKFRDFEEQMVNLQKYWRGAFMVCEKVNGFEDDYCDSLALMNLAGNHLYTPPSILEVTDNDLLGNHDRFNMAKGSRW